MTGRGARARLFEERLADGVDGGLQLLGLGAVGRANFLQRRLQRHQLERLVGQVRVEALAHAHAACAKGGGTSAAALPLAATAVGTAPVATTNPQSLRTTQYRLADC